MCEDNEDRCTCPPAPPQQILLQPLAWHAGRHKWQQHDGYPRHQHSINGQLTIDPHASHPHFEGSTFGEKSYDVADKDWPARESEHCWKTADAAGNLLISYRRYLSQTERQQLSDAVQVLMKLGGKVQRGEIKR